ncbi:hypothetical protein KCP77_12775 [Salmonella enterica subsp. enterica]|nr:hypothetical protein KCP77_12775 [Salmonella enterica subsp. enterica]
MRYCSGPQCKDAETTRRFPAGSKGCQSKTGGRTGYARETAFGRGRADRMEKLRLSCLATTGGGWWERGTRIPRFVRTTRDVTYFRPVEDGQPAAV